MKRSECFEVDLEARFGKVKMEQAQMNFLRGGDGDGSEDHDGPWDPPH
jgi:hypothetical protein